MLISHKKYPRKFTRLKQNRPLAFIDSTGFYDTSLRWSGMMTTQRVGDLLPFEFQSKDRFNPQINENQSTVRSSNSDIKTKLTAFDKYFKSVVLVPSNPIDRNLIIRKWTGPIFYKVYDYRSKKNDETISKNISEVFSQVSAITGLEINETPVDSTVNFFILIGNSPQKFKDIISAESKDYLARRNSDGSYYTTIDNAFLSMVQIIDLDDEPPVKIAWNRVMSGILKGLGIFNRFSGNVPSVVNANFKPGNDQLQALDIQVLKTLYNPIILPGMSESELDTIIKK